MNEVLESTKQRCKEAALLDVDVVQTVWEALMDAIQWSGKNQQQNINLALRQVWRILVYVSICFQGVKTTNPSKTDRYREIQSDKSSHAN